MELEFSGNKNEATLRVVVDEEDNLLVIMSGCPPERYLTAEQVLALRNFFNEFLYNYD